MKEFTLEVDGVLYRVEGEKLEDVWKFTPEGEEIKDFKMPDLWAENLDKVKERSLDEEIKEANELFKRREEFESLLENKEFLEKFLKHLKEL